MIFLRASTTSITFWLSDNSVHSRLYIAAQFCFLYEGQATAVQQEGYEITKWGTVVEWAGLGQRVSVEDVVDNKIDSLKAI